MCTAPSLQPAMILPAVEADPSTATAVASVSPGWMEAAVAFAEEAGEMSIFQDFFGAAAERLDAVMDDTEKQEIVPAPPASIANKGIAKETAFIVRRSHGGKGIIKNSVKSVGVRIA